MADELKYPAFPPPVLDTLSAHSSGRITRACPRKPESRWSPGW